MNEKSVKRHLNEARNLIERLRDTNRRNDYTVDLAMLEVIAEMALLNIVPDGTFSDNECVAWDVFRRIICQAKLNSESEGLTV